MTNYGIPKCISLNLTNRCNLNCVHCMNSSNSHLQDSLTLDDFEKIIKEMNELKVFRIDITGGEPLIRSDFKEIVNMFEKWQMLFLNTNATLINEDLAKYIAEKFKRVSVSIDGVNDVHDNIRGKGAFKRTGEGLEMLKKVYDVNRIFLTCTVTKLNCNNIEDVIIWAVDKGYKNLAFNVCKRLGRAQSENSNTYMDFKEKVGTYYNIKRLDEKYSGKINITYGSFSSYVKTLERITNTNNEKMVDNLLPCKAGLESCAILHNGFVVPCNSLDEEFCNESDNILNNSLIDIWNNSKFFLNWRDMNKVKVTENCTNCKLNILCTGGCRAEALVNSKKLDALDTNICIPYQLGYR